MTSETVYDALGVSPGTPMKGVRIIELGGIGPVPFAAGILQNLGADVMRVVRPRAPGATIEPGSVPDRFDLTTSGRPTLALDLKQDADRDRLLELIDDVHVVMEGFRPGVAERLGLGPQACLSRRGSLIYGRATGYGRQGPTARRAGHDINYLAANGVLSLIGRAGQPPTPPLGLVGDFGGAAMFLVTGILAALWEGRVSGQGRVVEVSTVAAAAMLANPYWGMIQAGTWNVRGANQFDSGAPFYDVYETHDGRWLAVGAVEPKFYAEFLDVLDLDPADLPDQFDTARWPEVKALISDRIRTRSLTDWIHLSDGRDACMSAVLTFAEAASDPQMVSNGVFSTVDGLIQAGGTPVFGGPVAPSAALAEVPAQASALVREGNVDVPSA